MYRRTIHPEDLKFLDTFAEIINKPPYPNKIDADYMKKNLTEAEVFFTCWGTPALTKDILDWSP